MKKFFLLGIAVALYTYSISQSRLVTAEYQKTQQPAIEYDVPFPEKTVSKSIDEYFQKLGYKGKDTKGYLIFRGVRLPELGADNYDLYFKTDRKSKKEKDATTVTMLISSGYDHFIGENTNATLIDNGKIYLESLTGRVEAYDLDQQIADQDASVKKSLKNLTNLTGTGEDLLKKKVKLENDIADNLKKQAVQKTESDKQQLILQTLKDKRKQ
jgi:Skp family chaperone for outer membrane proteins